MRPLLTAIALSFALILVAAPEQIREAPRPAAPIADAADATVMVHAEDQAGTGVCFHNGNHAFIWTDAHVVESRKRVERVVDAVTGQPGLRVWFADVEVWQDEVEEGRKVGSVRALAKIIRYSDVQDIALLKVYKRFPAKSVRFVDAVPVRGEPIFHIGSMAGARGIGSFAGGHIARVGRLRAGGQNTDTEEPLVYDQISVIAHPGSSGGGVFRAGDGACIGLIVEYLKPGTPGSFAINPVRRMREYAAATNCLWAMDADKPVPPVDAELPFSDRFIPLVEAK